MESTLIWGIINGKTQNQNGRTPMSEFISAISVCQASNKKCTLLAISEKMSYRRLKI